ncbi:Putative ring-cleaving dioxygenase MhqA [Listeria monocytogenes]|uniref:ring-cleaving dioxygenase n=1 Tax=Listeria monocytogenes TaxID=1639 RepID=UPI00164AF474|nr:ring-cleaving dioxygenase [Listeria monocytogenes]QNK19113.1 Putative ring-cleaving dioxygenase MhqA [Listeria monocytogenes]
MKLTGIHHVSIFTANARANFDFYTKIMGLRLVKKSVNQDDPYTYHLYYGDEIGSPGTALTFFEVPNMAKNHPSRNAISGLSLRVPSDEALHYWDKRLDEHRIFHSKPIDQFGRKIIRLKDTDGLPVNLISDETSTQVTEVTPWEDSPVPAEYAIRGLGPVRFSVFKKEKTDRLLTKILGFELIGAYEDDDKLVTVFKTGNVGLGGEVHVESRPDLEQGNLGAGGIHHVAFRVPTDGDLIGWTEMIQDLGYKNSGYVDRFYFHSLYFRESNGILIELATDEPGFQTDFTKEHGTYVDLPPHLEERREDILAHLKPLDTDK